ncbi:DUF1036 domain-containing protein [Prosthecomicrobium sp. N25]|uniref:DUF1036 domain-containing protein n=1 Tax=Prosthecomicrobium sp. N25 TaxID=3129254 RepID=UPI00307782A2
MKSKNDTGLRPLRRVRGAIAATATGLGVLAAAALATATEAAADLRICNKTSSRIGIAVGYKDEAAWTTEGWWNLPASTCETLLSGPLVSRYYYIYAIDYDRGGEWSGRSFMCTQEKTFTIKGIEDCIKRGFERTGFFEIDTGEQRSWTVQLTEPGRAGLGAAAGQ